MATILPFTTCQQQEWSQTEQAEFFRAVAILRGTGLPVVTESGLSDEGDPWTIFLREDTGDVVVHICRIDGHVVAASAASEDTVSGPSFRVVMDRILRSQPLVLPTSRPSDTVFMHPSAVITAFIATALVWSYSEEARIQQYDWSAADDGAVQPTANWARGPQSHSILRDAVLSKSDTVTGADAANGLSSRFVLAASVAAVAMAADMLAMPTVTGQAQGMQEEAPSSSETFAATPPTANDELSEFGNIAHTVYAQLFGLDDDAPQSATVREVEPGGAGGRQELVAFDTMRAEQETHPPVAGLTSAISFYEVAYHTPDIAPLSVPAAENFTRAAVGTSETVQNRITESVAASSGAPADDLAKHGGSHVVLSGDAAEFLSLIFSINSSNSSAAHLLPFHPVDLNSAGISNSTGISEVMHAVNFQALQSTDDIVLSSPSNAGSSDGGYKLVDDILAFAFDRTKELSTTVGQLEHFADALHSNAFLPAADRVLIIDVPDLQANAFKFADGLVMISYDLAVQLLPNMALLPQAELDLASGTTLKLIGVIDMTPDFQTFG